MTPSGGRRHKTSTLGLFMLLMMRVCVPDPLLGPSTAEWLETFHLSSHRFCRGCQAWGSGCPSLREHEGIFTFPNLSAAVAGQKQIGDGPGLSHSLSVHILRLNQAALWLV